MLTAGLFAQPAYGNGDTGPPRCSISASTQLPLGQFVAQMNDWQCPAKASNLAAQRNVIRFDMANWAGPKPHYVTSLSSRLTQFSILAVDHDGTSRSRNYAFNDLQPELLDRQFSAELPPITAQTKTIYIAIEGASQSAVIDYVQLAHERPGNSLAERNKLLMLAALCGLLLMPLALNFAYYPVLREDFILWHSVITLSTLLHVLCSTGLINLIMPLSMGALRILAIGTIGIMIAGGAMFCASFIERDCISSWTRRLLHGAAIAIAMVAAIHAGGFNALGHYPSDLFFVSCGLILLVFSWTLAQALRNNSRAIWFQILAWAPMMVFGAVRVVSYLMPGIPPMDVNSLFHIAIAIEVLGTMFGVSDRFMTIRRQRDKARTMAMALETLSEKDPLTGLTNRRAIQPRFDLLRRDGYHSFALLDLDQFKLINDNYGHTIGDEVLQATARALGEDGDTLAARFGGEEFVLFLRGKNTRIRAERIRTNITMRVAHDVPGLAGPVTASMGLIELPRNDLFDTSFLTTYDHADRLLYQAKEAGRNCTAYERLTMFGPSAQHRQNVPDAA